MSKGFQKRETFYGLLRRAEGVATRAEIAAITKKSPQCVGQWIAGYTEPPPRHTEEIMDALRLLIARKAKA